MTIDIAPRVPSGPLPEAVEQVLVHGDLSKLSTQERLKFYIARCEAAGLDPRCRPFEYISLQGKLTLYAKKECAEQLNGLHGISHKVSGTVVDEKTGLVEVTVEASKGSRVTFDVGIVPIKGLVGADLANAKMKAVTKAKRRATLSLCGLGDVVDETELETIRDTRPCTPEGQLIPPDNGSGHGRGTFASDDDAKRIIAREEEFLDKANSLWRDRWASVCKGVVPSDIHDPCNLFQLDAHMTKWSIQHQHIDPDSTDEQGLKRHQLGKLTALVFYRRGRKVQGEFIAEVKRYYAEQEDVQLAKIAKRHPELFEVQDLDTTDDDEAIDAAMDEIAAEGK